MPKLHFSIELNPHTPAERRALIACKKWLKLKSDGRLSELKAKQKEVFLSGLFMHISTPELAQKLAANLDDVDDLSLQEFISRLHNKTDQAFDIQAKALHVESLNQPTPLDKSAASLEQFSTPLDTLTASLDQAVDQTANQSAKQASEKPQTQAEDDSLAGNSPTDSSPTDRSPGGNPQARSSQTKNSQAESPSTESSSTKSKQGKKATSLKDRIKPNPSDSFEPVDDVKEQLEALKGVREKGIF